jgi:hypothetical protein
VKSPPTPLSGVVSEVIRRLAAEALPEWWRVRRAEGNRRFGTGKEG